MTITYPRTIPALLMGASRFEIVRQDISSSDGLGYPAGGSLGTDRWMLSAEFHGLGDRRALALQAFLDSLDGSAQRFLGYDRRCWWPYAYRETQMAGMTVTASSFSVSSSGQGLTLHGLDAGTVLDTGDMVGFKGGPSSAYRHAVRIVEGGTVDGSGDITLDVRPAVWPNVQAWSGVVAHLDKPSVTMRLTPDTEMSDTTAEGYMTARIVALQDLIQEG